MSEIKSKQKLTQTHCTVFRSSRFILWSLYVGFVVYGSLVPLDFHYLPWGQAWESFKTVKLLDVGAQGRADWLSNGVLYVPVGFFTVNLLIEQKNHSASVWHLVVSLLFSLALAICVEYAQLYFPPRTVSLNDLIAEFLGAIIGVVIAYQWGGRFRSLPTSWREVSRDQVLTYLLELYAFLYIAFSVFPFDFIVSADEFEWKRYGDSWGWLIAKDFANSSSVIFLAKLLAEILAIIPLGLLWANLRAARKSYTHVRAITAGLGFGLGVEIIQFFLFSGISQGVSVLTRALGLWIGALIWNRRGRISIEYLASVLRQYALIVVIVYLFSVMVLTGWLDHPWGNIDSAIRVLLETRFLPFYYHYYTTEQAALLSVTAVALIYAPIGVIVWSTRKALPPVAFLIAALMAFCLETSKLFLEGLHPDPTNILIAGATAFGVTKLAALFSDMQKHTVAELHQCDVMIEVTPPGALGVTNLASEGVVPLRSLSRSGVAIFCGCLLFFAWWIATFPVFSVFLGIFMVGYGVLLWSRPHLMLAVLPAAIALLDFAPWSGRYFFDEFDLMLFISLVIGYLRTPPVMARSKQDRLYIFALWLFGLSCLCSVFVGIFPWKPMDANSFSHYYSPFNTLRVAKGWLWAFLLYGLFARFASEGRKVARLFALGMAGGVTGTVSLIIWERIAFPGFLNFSDVYRVTGPFSQMHIGGADLETYLTIAAPLLVMLFFEQVSIWLRIAYALLLLGATYGVMVTFSRVGYAGFGVTFTLGLLAATIARSRIWPLGLFNRVAISSMLFLAVLGIAIPITIGPFAQERMAMARADLMARQNHWNATLSMRDSGWVTAILGMGIGRYPDTHFWRSNEEKAGSYWLESESENTFVKLGVGGATYVEQFISLQPDTDYFVELSARSLALNAQLTLAICEKWLLTSARCSSEKINFSGDGGWKLVKTHIQSDKLGVGPWYARRPVKFSLVNSSPSASVELDNIKITDAQGVNLLENGDFSQNIDHWFFSVDNDLPWHVWSLPVQILFDQGWLGVMTFGLFVILGLWRAGRQAWRGVVEAGAFMSAGIGFLVIGTLDSLVDSPRLLLLFLLVIWLCWSSPSLPRLRGH